MERAKFGIFDLVAAQNLAADEKRSLDGVELDEESRARLKSCERDLQPVRLNRVNLPLLPMARLAPDANLPCPTCIADELFVVLGEIAQWPGRVIAVGLATGKIYTEFNVDQLDIHVVE